MANTLERLKAECEALTSQERMDLVLFLLTALEPDADEGVDAAWEAEVARRVEEIRSGRAVGIPADQLFADLREQEP